MHFVYILKSEKVERFYVGSTGDIKTRLASHNAGRVKSTKAYRPWKLILFEEFKEKRDALSRERQIKSYKSGEGFRNLITERWQSG